jgi:hypothetical protein
MTNTTDNKVTVTDANNRAIEIRRLSAFDRMKLFAAAGAELSENMQWISYALCASAVTAIDGVMEPFPTSQRAIETRVKLLGDAGIECVGRGYKEHFSAGETGDLAEIKN